MAKHGLSSSSLAPSTRDSAAFAGHACDAGSNCTAKESADSLRRQAEVEAADIQTFEEFLEDYLALP